MKIASPSVSSDEDDTTARSSTHQVTQDAPTMEEELEDEDEAIDQTGPTRNDDDSNTNDADDDDPPSDNDNGDDDAPEANQEEDTMTDSKEDEGDEASDEEQEPEAPTMESEEPEPTEPPLPPTVNAIVQHLRDTEEKQAWATALAETTSIPQIYVTTASDQLHPVDKPTSTIHVYKNWAATKEEDTVAQIATGFAIMEQGPGPWMQDAFAAMIRDKHPPAQPFLARLTAADRFTVLHGRTSIRTSQLSAQKDLWAAFTVDTTGDEQRVLLAKPYLFRAGKVISPVEVLQGQMLQTGTKATTNKSEQANTVPTICPIPLTWAATILTNPSWTAQMTAQYVASQMLLWDLTDEHVSATAERVWNYLCGALTAGSKARPTVRFRFSANAAAFDPPATSFLDNLQQRLWGYAMTPPATKRAPTVKVEQGRRSSGRLQQRQQEQDQALVESSQPTTSSAAATPGTLHNNPDDKSTTSDMDTKPTSGNKGNKPPRTPKPNTGQGSTKANTVTTPATSTKSGLQQKGTTRKQSNSGSKALPPASKTKTQARGAGAGAGPVSNLRLARTNVLTGTKRPTAAGAGRTPAKASKRTKRNQATTPLAGAQPALGGTGTTTAAAQQQLLPASAATLTALLQSPDILARTLGALAQAQVTQANQLEEQRTMNQHFRAITAGGASAGDTDPTTARKSKWNDSKKARFAAWANLPMDSPLLPDFWPAMIQAASDDKEALITGLFNGLRNEHWEFQGWEPSPQLVADIQKLVLRPPMMSENKYHRGINPMAFADVDLQELEAAWANNAMLNTFSSKLSLSTTEAMALEHKAPVQPRTIETLRLCIRRCMLFLKETMGNQCYYYVIVKDLCAKLLRLTQRLKHSPAFMQQRGPSILWELSHVGFDFFGQVFTANDFLEAVQFDEPVPKATAPASLDHLLRLDIGPSADLPAAWLPPSRYERQPQPGAPRQTGQQGGGNNNNNRPPKQKPARTGQLDAAWAPGFQALFQPYSVDQRRKVALKPLLQQANKDLKWITAQLGVPAKQCMKSTVFGTCPDHCKLTHATSPPPADKVAKVVATFKPLVPALFSTA